MKVCFVYPDIEGAAVYGAKKFYHGIGYLSSVLKQAGHATALIYLQAEVSRSDFLARVAATSPDLVAFSSTTNQFPFVRAWSAWLKECMPRVPTICGGAHPTLAPEKVIAEPGIDMLCVGEGEIPLRELVAGLEKGGDVTAIRNLWLKQDGQVIRNPLRPLLNLDDLPFPDREIFGFEQILRDNDGWVDLMAGRGCPYECSYCCNPGLKRTYRGLGAYTRNRSAANVMAEVRELATRYRVKTLNFQDDVFTLDHEWTQEFCRAYRGSFTLPFWINTRVERIRDEEVVGSLAEAGCRGVRIGLESGNEGLRRDILKRKMSNEDIVRVFRLAQKHGLATYTCNMIGIPGETPAMMQETIDFNRRLAPTSLQFSVFYPYPMTELHDVCIQNGYYGDGENVPTYYGRTSLLHMPQLSQEAISGGYDRFAQLKHELETDHHDRWRYRLSRLLDRILAMPNGQ